MLSPMLGAFISEVRRSRGLTQTEVADISGIPQSSISAFERDRRVPSATNLHRILHACGYQLAASAGARQITCRPPATDPFLDSLEPLPPVPPMTEAEHNRRLTAALELSSEIVRSRAARR